MTYKNKAHTYESQIKRWIRIKLKAIQYKGGKCQKCGFTGHYACFDFHHTNPKEKEAVWTKLRLRSWDKITQELDKCQVLCANCHRIEHAHPIDWHKEPVIKE